MTWYDYQNATAFDPYTKEGVPDGVGEIFDLADTGYATPLTAVLMGSGLQTQQLPTDQFCQLEGFQVENLKQVRFKSGAFTKVMNTTTPLVGPVGPVVAGARNNGDGTATFTLSDGTDAATVELLPGPEGPVGPKGLDATDAAQDDTALEGFILTDGTKTKAALSATYTNVIDAGRYATLADAVAAAPAGSRVILRPGVTYELPTTISSTVNDLTIRSRRERAIG